MEPLPTSSIILLVKNGERYLGELLDSVFAQRDAGSFEVIAIDSGSRDRSKEILRKFPLHLHEIPPQEFNHGGTRESGCKAGMPGFAVSRLSDARCNASK